MLQSRFVLLDHRAPVVFDFDHALSILSNIDGIGIGRFNSLKYSIFCVEYISIFSTAQNIYKIKLKRQCFNLQDLFAVNSLVL